MSLPLWVLKQSEIDSANVVALRWALFYFAATCKRYRHAIEYDVRHAFGGGRTGWTLGWMSLHPVRSSTLPCIAPSARRWVCN